MLLLDSAARVSPLVSHRPTLPQCIDSTMQPRSQEAFHFLRIIDDVFCKQGRLLQDMRSYDEEGKPTGTFRMPPHNDPTPEVPYVRALLFTTDWNEYTYMNHYSPTFGCLDKT